MFKFKYIWQVLILIILTPVLWADIAQETTAKDEVTPDQEIRSIDELSASATVDQKTTATRYLTSIQQIPNFKSIKIPELVENISTAIRNCNAAINTSLLTTANFDTSLIPIIDQLAIVKSYWNLLIILNSVTYSSQSQKAIDASISQMARFQSDLIHNQSFYELLKTIKNSKDFSSLDISKQTFVNSTLLDCKQNGMELDPIAKKRYLEITQQLRALGMEFKDNLSQATNQWQYHIPNNNAQVTTGIPNTILNQAKQKADGMGKDGWIFDLDSNNLIAIETFAKDRKLRENFYKAFITMASGQDPDLLRRKWDNTQVVAQTIELRQELATLLGYNNFAEFANQDRIPPDPAQALQFLQDTATKVKPFASKEYQALCDFAKVSKQNMQPWDVAYYAQWYKATIAKDSQKKSREYLQTDAVLQGMFNLASILFNVDFQQVEASTWDDAVKLYIVTDVANKKLGYFYLDLYSRSNKSTQNKNIPYLSRLSAQPEILPVVVLSTNLSNNNNQLSFNELKALFYQFGDVLARIVAKQDFPLIPSSYGMLLDAYANSSMFMQNWIWQKQYIQDVAKKINSQEKLPDELFDVLLKTEQFDVAINLLQQLQLAIFDLRIHLNLPSDENKSALEIYNEIKSEFEVLPAATLDILPNRSIETFASNYAATYYCYYWDKFIANNAMQIFIDNQLFSAKIGHKFRETLLEQAGQASILELYNKFTPRPPEINTYLNIEGIAAHP